MTSEDPIVNVLDIETHRCCRRYMAGLHVKKYCRRFLFYKSRFILVGYIYTYVLLLVLRKYMFLLHMI